MCIVFLSLGCHPGYKVIVLDNRDEVFGRPTSMVSEWEGEDIIAGKVNYMSNILHFLTWNRT